MEPDGKVCAPAAVEPFSLHCPFQEQLYDTGCSYRKPISRYSSSVELPSVSHSSNVHQALALSRLSDTELQQTVLTVEKLMGQWESHQITKPLLSLPLSRLRATGPNSIAWPCIVFLLAFVLVISSPERKFPSIPFHLNLTSIRPTQRLPPLGSLS